MPARKPPLNNSDDRWTYGCCAGFHRFHGLPGHILRLRGRDHAFHGKATNGGLYVDSHRAKHIDMRNI
eukprot:7922692-Prorocentrum_lima.AAC.1